MAARAAGERPARRSARARTAAVLGPPALAHGRARAATLGWTCEGLDCLASGVQGGHAAASLNESMVVALLVTTLLVAAAIVVLYVRRRPRGRCP